MDYGASSYRRFLDGDQDAFSEVMKYLFHPLVFFIHRYVQDIHTAEDLAMDVFTILTARKRPVALSFLGNIIALSRVVSFAESCPPAHSIASTIAQRLAKLVICIKSPYH